MYKVILIDDEPIIREGMKHVIKWEDYGFTVAGDGENARDGMQLIDATKPDLIFVDIRMPGTSGMEFIKQAKQAGCDAKFVILSGYSSFNYARESIKLGIHSYLLKPIDEQELIEILVEIKAIIADERKVSSQLTAYHHLSEEEAWKAVMDGRIEDWGRFSYIEHQQGPFRLAGISFKENIDWVSLKERLATNHYHFTKVIIKDEIMYLLYSELLDEVIESEINQLCYDFKRELNSLMLVCLSARYQSLAETPKAIEQISDLQSRSYSFNSDQIFKYPLEQQQTAQTFNSEQIGAKLIQALEFKDYQALKIQSQLVINYFQACALDKARVQAEMIECVLLISQMISKQYPEVVMPNKQEWLVMIYHSYNLEALIDRLNKEWWAITKQINGFVITPENNIEKITNYVDQYYHQDLSLKVLADLFNYNSSYLGKKFKKHTGEYFHAYLERIRIEKAKQILSNKPYKVYKVSELVGYSNMDYFYKKFKKYVGMSPKEYQKKMQAQHT
ncbi:response regulator transcription factor [Amphibacillus cookii]|uniref:response regulator transcription factor n=1 Tax=Amphibacillus cookii TaxID=767787 RepID=UPI001957EAC1|nr:response regulator transcription factor [Amphibacillus cookii]MBM7541597.1 two-component system response regulator YesN [Amphibacillus cookii]